MKHLLFAISIAFFLFQSVTGQNPVRFQEEINRFKADSTDYTGQKDLVLFTGSSTIRMWSGIQEDFPHLQVLNRGFGGSCMSDLLYYADTVIMQCRPSLIFIYEGDNDLAMNIKTRDILNDAGRLVSKIREILPDAEICFLAPKPSLARWNLAPVYLDFNKQLKRFTRRLPGVYYLNLWDCMIGSDGKPIPGIFLEDGLHMNRSGYDIWKHEITNFLSSRLHR